MEMKSSHEDQMRCCSEQLIGGGDEKRQMLRCYCYSLPKALGGSEVCSTVMDPGHAQ